MMSERRSDEDGVFPEFDADDPVVHEIEEGGPENHDVPLAAKALHATSNEIVPPSLPDLSDSREPAKLPQGLFLQIDYILRNPGCIMESLRRDEDLWALSRVCLVITLFTGALYGLVMGGTNWFQGAPVPWTSEYLMMLITAIKVPSLFLFTFSIVVTSIYVSSTFVGSRASFRQIVTLLLASLAITTIALASMASVSLFFALTTRSYNFIKVLHVLFFAYAGLVGLNYMGRGFNAIVGVTLSDGHRWLFIGWILLYMFVGTQLAWVMRPFVGSPDMPFQIFRERSGNFYENVYESLIIVIFEDEKAKPPKLIVGE